MPFQPSALPAPKIRTIRAVYPTVDLLKIEAAVEDFHILSFASFPGALMVWTEY